MRLEIRGVEKLSWRERQVVALKESGHSTEAIAQRLGIGEGTVATLYNRARKKGYEVVLIIDGDPLGIGEDLDGSQDLNKAANRQPLTTQASRRTLKSNYIVFGAR